MATWHNLSININASNDFDDQSDGPTHGTSSNFTSGSFTSSSTSPVSSRRPSRCSEPWLLQYHSGPSSMASTGPATPLSTSSFSMATFTNDTHIPMATSAMEWAFQDGSHLAQRIDDDAWSTIAQPDSLQKSHYLDWNAVYSQLGHNAFDPDVSRHFSQWSGLSGLSALPKENEFLPEHEFDPLAANTAQGDDFWTPNSSYQQPLTIVPSHTLVNRPKTPLPVLAEGFQTPIKLERDEWQGQHREFSSPILSPTKTVFNSRSISSSCPSASTVTKRRVKSGSRRITYDFIKNKSGKKFYQRLGTGDVNGQPGEVLPIDHIAEEKPSKNVCGFRENSGIRCTRSFKRGEHLTRHRKIHDKKPTIPCPVCTSWGKITRISADRMDNLTTHVVKTHMTESSSGRNNRGRKDSMTGQKVDITPEWLKSHGIDIEGSSKRRLKQEKR